MFSHAFVARDSLLDLHQNFQHHEQKVRNKINEQAKDESSISSDKGVQETVQLGVSCCITVGVLFLQLRTKLRGVLLQEWMRLMLIADYRCIIVKGLLLSSISNTKFYSNSPTNSESNNENG